MQDKVTYEYAIIRLVPQVEREEFLNIGAIVFSKRKKFLELKYHLDPKRIRCLSEEVDLDLVKKYLEGWEEICKGDPYGGKIGTYDQGFRFRWLIAERSTIIQSSRVHPGICDDPIVILEQVFEKFVL